MLETPNGLSASASLTDADPECQCYLKAADFSPGTRPQLFSRTQVSARTSPDQTHRELVYRPLQFHERSQHFICAHNETLSVAMRVGNVVSITRSAYRIERVHQSWEFAGPPR